MLTIAKEIKYHDLHTHINVQHPTIAWLMFVVWVHFLKPVQWLILPHQHPKLLSLLQQISPCILCIDLRLHQGCSPLPYCISTCTYFEHSPQNLLMFIQLGTSNKNAQVHKCQVCQLYEGLDGSSNCYKL